MYNNPNSDFSFAVIADSHSYYDELRDAIKIISMKKDVCFVLHLGDFADCGLLFEYVSRRLKY
jgi:predicted phosphodiesterase